ncbi:protein Red-like [Schistocerca gregaria]|uniref:protein Red-like n=1 Tax=Schistocerca gregaria TaxID=7010 RepID=UPI00211E8983|nr:protein Red-like [Schistocerca gregaria]
MSDNDNASSESGTAPSATHLYAHLRHPSKPYPTPHVHSTPRARFAAFNSTPKKSAHVAKQPFAKAPASSDLNECPETKRPKPYPYSSKYRDRAYERRMATEMMSKGEKLDEVFSARLSPNSFRRQIENNEYLVEDEETTYLVQGIDAALLEKRKLEIEEEEAERMKQAEQKAAGSQNLAAKQLVVTQDGKAMAIDVPQDFQTYLGRQIYNVLFKREMPQPLDIFLLGRTSYCFTLDPSSSKDIPTIIERQIENYYDRDTRYESVCISTNPEILKKLSVLMSYIKKGPKGLKQRKADLEMKEKCAKQTLQNLYATLKRSSSNASSPTGEDSFKAPTASKSKEEAQQQRCEDSDEDIFGDLKGRVYDPSAYLIASNIKSKSQIWKDVVEADGQSSNDRPLGTTDQVKSAVANNGHLSTIQFDAGIQVFENEEYDGMDDYGESEEEDLMTMDNRVKLKRADFENDQEWEKYEANREAIPKAAFQFGVKFGDGRRLQRRGKNEKRRIYHVLQKKVSGSIKKED